MQYFSRATASFGFLTFFSSVAAMNPDDPGPGDVAFTITTTGTATPISPKIYSVNGALRPSGLGGIRLGGNRWTGYNWETNNSNAGEDFFNYNDGFLVGSQPNTPPGQAVLPTLQETSALDVVANVTVPMAGYVSADDNREVFPIETAPSARWNQLVTRKMAIYPGQQLSLTPDQTDNYVFTDEFVNWVESKRQGGQQVMYLLDNEPGLWDNTHPRLYGTTNPTFADVGQRSIATASAIKDIAPDAKVLGGVTFGWDAMSSLNGAPDFDQQVPEPRDLDGLHFNRWLLETMAAEEALQGRALMDVLDVHWYPEARGGGVRITAEGATNNSPAVVEARLQAPRSLWDPTYIEDSYITEFITFDYSDAGNHEGVELLNRIKADIDELKPGTLISVSEYNYGGGNHISGGIAQADVLGVFGREGVYNASWWPIQAESNSVYVKAGFEMFTDFDGEGGRFGDLSVAADTNDIAQSAIYASESTENEGEMILVAINRTNTALNAAIQITDEQAYTSVEVFQLTDANAEPVFAGQFSLELLNAFLYEMPAYSVSTIRLTAAQIPGDYNGDGSVNGDDLLVWRNEYASSGPFTADGDNDSDVDGADFLLWQQQNGNAAGSALSQAIPEPTSLALLVTFAAVIYSRSGLTVLFDCASRWNENISVERS